MSRALAAACLVAALGCGPRSTSTFPRPIGEEPMGLLPSGADAVLDVDVPQLREWQPAERLRALLPESARAALDGLGFDPLADVEQLWVGLYDLGTPDQHTVLVLKSGLTFDVLKKTLGPGAEELDWRGARLAEAADDAQAGGRDERRAVAQPLPGLAVLGPRLEVRRALELVHGEGVSVKGDKALMAALQRAPTAKLGRPAVMMALVLGDKLREELRKAQLPLVEAEWLGGSMAVDAGFDVGAIIGFRGPAEAKDLVKEGLKRTDAFRRSLAARALGLSGLVEPLMLVQREDEVHLAYRVPGKLLARLLDRLEQGAELRRQRAAATGDAAPPDTSQPLRKGKEPK